MREQWACVIAIGIGDEDVRVERREARERDRVCARRLIVGMGGGHENAKNGGEEPVERFGHSSSLR
jgi:hypothetical protein